MVKEAAGLLQLLSVAASTSEAYSIVTLCLPVYMPWLGYSAATTISLMLPCVTDHIVLGRSKNQTTCRGCEANIFTLEGKLTVTTGAELMTSQPCWSHHT
jgi:hypothetical protein